jgi:hypothetical protein
VVLSYGEDTNVGSPGYSMGCWLTTAYYSNSRKKKKSNLLLCTKLKIFREKGWITVVS